jgi:integrase/recombinase XerD
LAPVTSGERCYGKWLWTVFFKWRGPAERDAFLKAADDAEVREVRTFCATLACTGCRISEALALTADRIDLKDGTIVIESAKKRQTGVYRPIPVPPALFDMLNLVHDIRGGA